MSNENKNCFIGFLTLFFLFTGIGGIIISVFTLSLPLFLISVISTLLVLFKLGGLAKKYQEDKEKESEELEKVKENIKGKQNGEIE